MTPAKVLWCGLFCICFSFLFPFTTAKAQTNDLMFVEYVDANSGAGFAVTIYNPTPEPIDMGARGYKVLLQNNNRLVDSAVLTTVLQPGAIWKVGNASHCNGDCPGNCDQGFVGNSNGVNGDDAIALVKGRNNAFVDMLGLWGNAGSTRINGTNNAFFQRRLVRQPSHCTRYTSTSGSGANSWPSASNVNVSGWSVFPASGANSCLAASFNFVFDPTTFTLGPDLDICATTNAGITLSSPITTGVTYTWSTGSSASSITVRTSGVYWLRVSNGQCSITDTIKVNYVIPQLAGVGPDRVICAGRPIWIRKTVAGTATWSTGEVGDSIQIGLPGTYTVAVNTGSCISRDTVNVTVRPNQRGFLGADLSLCRGDLKILNAPLGTAMRLRSDFGLDSTVTSRYDVRTPGVYTAQLLNAATTCLEMDTITIRDGVISDSLPSRIVTCIVGNVPIVAPLGMDSYRWSTGETTREIVARRTGGVYVVVSRNGCQDTLRTEVVSDNCTWFIPNVITVNGDGKNEAWQPSRDVFSTVDCRVYNRYGVPVFTTTDRQLNWTPDNLPSGLYFYRIVGTLASGEPADLKGWVELMR